MNNQITGQNGEQLAQTFLKKLGYTIVDTNVRLGHDEIDIIAFDPQDGVYCFTEVKTRSVVNEFNPALNITTKKKNNMKRAALKWVAKQEEEIGFRIDVILIAGDQVSDHWIDIGLLETDPENTATSM